MKLKLFFVLVFVFFAPRVWAAKILIYGPMLTSTPNEKTIAEAAGHTVTVVSASQWTAMTSLQFASFDAIVIPDNGCRSTSGNSDPNLSIINSNKSVWAPVVTGNLYVIASDPLFHRQGQYQALLSNAINFVASGSGTGFYACLSCNFVSSGGSQVAFLSYFGNFIVSDAHADDIKIVERSHPTMIGLTDLGLSHWGNTAHNPYLTVSSSRVITIATASIYPMILASPVVSNSITTSTLVSSPLCDGSPVGIPFTATGTFNSGNIFTAQLSNAAGSFGSPISIGALSSATSGTINATIPANIPAGTGYRIRVISSDPEVIGRDNGSNITINSRPAISVPTIAAVNNTPGQCGATVEFEATATGTPTPAITYKIGETEILSPHFFPVGTTTVTATATNGCGMDVKTFTVTIVDNELPVIISNGNQTVGNDAGVCGAEVAVSASASDNCSVGTPTGVRSDALALDALYPVGTTTITWNVTDANGNAAPSVVQTVTVTDTEAPVARTKNIQVTLVNGEATITAEDVDDNSTDNCGIPSDNYNIDKTNFTCNDIGNHTVTLTVKDNSGNVHSATAVVTVIGAIPAPTISVSRTDNTYTGVGTENTVFLGYGAQSLTLTASNPTSATYSWSPANNLSNTTTANPEFTPTSAGIYIYTVTATNEYGCSNVTTVTLSVIDARCSSGKSGKLDKVLVCHKGKEICISPDGVQDHLAHGCTIGSCSSGTVSATNKLALSGQEASQFYSYPTAFSEKTTIAFTLDKEEDYLLEVFDMRGALVKKLAGGSAEANKLYEFELRSDGMAEGLFITRLTTSSTVKSLKVVLKR